MLEIYERLGTHCHELIDARVILTHEQRDKGRLRTASTEGDEIRIFLERGSPLSVGEYLKSQCGKTILVEGAIEPVAVARCSDWFVFSRACYHLGNRHVKLQIGELVVKITPDHVLEEMLSLQGLTVTHENDVFEPESGAYGHAHSHEH